MIGSTSLSVNLAPGQDSGTWVLTPHGELALHTRFLLRASVERALGHAPIVLAIDLRSLDFIDGAGVAALVVASRRCAAQGVRCVVVRGGGQIGRLLDITGLDELVEVIDGSRLAFLADPAIAAA